MDSTSIHTLLIEEILQTYPNPEKTGNRLHEATLFQDEPTEKSRDSLSTLRTYLPHPTALLKTTILDDGCKLHSLFL